MNESAPFQSGSRSRSARSALATAIVAHGVLLASILIATHLAFGSQGAITPANQIPWTPLVRAQLYLLAIYLGLGGGSAWVRLSLFLCGVAAASAATQSAYLLLTPWPGPIWRSYLLFADMYLVMYLLPMLCVGVLLLPLRTLWGAIQAPETSEQTRRFHIGNLLALTTVVAVAAGVFAGVERWEVGVSIDYRRMPREIAAATLGLAGATWFSLAAGRMRFLGLAGLICGVIAGWFVWPKVDWTDWVGPCYTYAAVLLTLLWLRRAGYRVRGGVFSGSQRTD
jgi:hypothetical protein